MGPDPELAAELATALRQHAHLLDVHADAAHARTVVTLAATDAEAVLEGLLAVVDLAVRRIDLRRHSGVHPRLGAADVVPLVPLRGASMEECVSLAHRLGRRIWEELGVPVHFYGRAARQAGSEGLAAIRRGGLPPDLGGPSLHPTAGAVCVGARLPLVAYNVLLPGVGRDLAARSARALRESAGGLPGVQALAFELPDGVMQLSTNLVRLDLVTPSALLAQVLRMAPGAGPDEVVGLCPARAACPAAEGRLLEGRLASAAAATGALLLRALGGDERDRLAGRLEREARSLAALGVSQEDLLAGAERSLALARVLAVAGLAKDDLGSLRELLATAASGFRAGVEEATARRHTARWALLDGET